MDYPYDVGSYTRAVTTGSASLSDVTARFSPPEAPRSMTTERGFRASILATTRFKPSSLAPSGFRQLAAMLLQQKSGTLEMDAHVSFKYLRMSSYAPP